MGKAQKQRGGETLKSSENEIQRESESPDFS